MQNMLENIAELVVKTAQMVLEGYEVDRSTCYNKSGTRGSSRRNQKIYPRINCTTKIQPFPKCQHSVIIVLEADMSD